MILFFIIIMFLCWGSFLNVVGHRLITNQDIVFLPSHCPHCKTPIAWHDLIPVFSWIWLGGRCRTCHAPISYLYPFIELFTAITGLLLLLCVPYPYWIAYFLIFSALIVSIRTDLEHMLLSQYMNIYLIPFCILACFLGMLPLSPVDSIVGAACGYGFLFALSYICKILTGKECIGEGDADLLAFIGSFTGIIGCWISLTIGSGIGSILGIAYLVYSGKNQGTKIPFGPFLAIGAIIYVLFQDQIVSFIFF